MGRQNRAALVDATIERFAMYLHESGVFKAALASIVLAEDQDQLSEIRRFFFDSIGVQHRRPCTTLARTVDDVVAIYEYRVCEYQESHADRPVGAMRVRWSDAVGAAKVFHIFSSSAIERALADDFERIHAPTWRTRPVFLDLPRWLVDEIEREPAIPSTLDLARRIESILTLRMTVAGNHV